jgi:hypothetical protein
MQEEKPCGRFLNIKGQSQGLRLTITEEIRYMEDTAREQLKVQICAGKLLFEDTQNRVTKTHNTK